MRPGWGFEPTTLLKVLDRNNLPLHYTAVNTFFTLLILILFVNPGKLGLNTDNGDNVERAVLDQPADQNENATGQRVVDDETESVTYSYTFFHVTMIFACLYLMMTITNWYK